MVGVRDRVPHKRSGLVLRRTNRVAHLALKPSVEFAEGALVTLVFEILQRNLGLLEAFLVLSRGDHTFGATKPSESIMIDALQGQLQSYKQYSPADARLYC